MTRPAKALGPTALLAALLLSGCFRYVPTPVDVAPPGEDVRLLVTRQGAADLAQVTDVEGEVPTVRGTLLERRGAEMLLSVPVGQRRDGFHTVSLDQTIRIPVSEILQVERREFDTPKTAFLVAGAVGGSAFIIFSIMSAFGESDGSDPGGPEESRIPIPFISVPIGR